MLPDNYLWIETDDNRRLQRGFSGEIVLHKLEALRPGREGRASVGPGFLSYAKSELARLVLGLLAEPRTAITLTEVFEPAAVATVKFLAPDGTPIYLETDGTSHLPMSVRYSVSPPPGLTGNVGARGTPNLNVPVVTDQERKIQVTMRLSAWRTVDGIQLPFRIDITEPASYRREIRLDEILVNAQLDREDFLQAAKETHSGRAS